MGSVTVENREPGNPTSPVNPVNPVSVDTVAFTVVPGNGALGKPSDLDSVERAIGTLEEGQASM